jgi:hypothetical protein
VNERPNIPFMPEKGKPPLHLREWTLEELERHQRMLRAAEWRAKQTTPNRESAAP